MKRNCKRFLPQYVLPGNIGHALITYELSLINLYLFFILHKYITKLKDNSHRAQF